MMRGKPWPWAKFAVLAGDAVTGLAPSSLTPMQSRTLCRSSKFNNGGVESSNFFSRCIRI